MAFTEENIIYNTQNYIKEKLKNLNDKINIEWLKSTIYDSSNKNSILPINYKDSFQEVRQFDNNFLVRDERDHVIKIKNMEYLTNSFQGKISYDKGKSTVKKIECQINLYFQKGPQLTTYMENRKLEGRLRSSTISDCLIVFPKEGEITDNLILDKYKSDKMSLMLILKIKIILQLFIEEML